MKIRIDVCTESGELLATDEVEISTHPETIRAAKMQAGVVVEDAVNMLIEKAVTPA